MKTPFSFITGSLLVTTLLLAGNVNSNAADLVDYKPKTTFTSSADIESFRGVNEDFSEQEVNKLFVGSCYYTGDTSTPFLASFAERYNHYEFLRRFINAEELFERINTDSDEGDSNNGTVHVTMPTMPNELQLAFLNEDDQANAAKLLNLLNTVEYVPEQLQQMLECFYEVGSISYNTPDFISSDELESMQQDFWTLYDKSKYVSGYDEIKQMRSVWDEDEAEFERMYTKLQQKYVQETNFDTRCIYAIEMACFGMPDAPDYLGELMEDGQYSKYLFEVWLVWRYLTQSNQFGASTWSEIPDNYYDTVRLMVAQRYVDHISANPSDVLAKYLLLNIINTENLRRFSGYYGNEAMGAELIIRTKIFQQ